MGSLITNPGPDLHLWVFGVSDNKAEVRFKKFKMTDLIWQTKFGKLLRLS